MGQGAFIWSRTEEIISPHQPILTNRGSDQRSSARKANYRSLSSPTGRYLLVCSSRLRQKELESRCVRLLEDVMRPECLPRLNARARETEVMSGYSSPIRYKPHWPESS